MTTELEIGLYIFILAGFLGYHVITRVPPLLHTPLMSATNASSGISLIGSLVVAGANYSRLSTVLGFIAVTCSSTNVVGGFLITDRMLKMFKRREEVGIQHRRFNPKLLLAFPVLVVVFLVLHWFRRLGTDTQLSGAGLSITALRYFIETLRVRGSVFCRSELRAPWGMSLQARGVAHFHAVERGRCVLRLRGMRQPVHLEAGDLVMVPHDRGHVLSEPEVVSPRAMIAVEELDSKASCRYLCNSGRGAETRLICGAFRFERDHVHPLLSLLPPLIHLESADGQMPKWLEATVRLLAAETRAPRAGTETIVTRLTDVIFVQLLRAWAERLPVGKGGWLGALRDPQIGAALGLIHRETHRPWTVATLAKAVGSSRSPFAARFRELVGEPPLIYLTRWRMQSAAGLLDEGRLTVAEIAERVGYESLPAFSKAFKRRTGRSPSSWRRRRQPS